jgi:hypothetical protein
MTERERIWPIKWPFERLESFTNQSSAQQCVTSSSVMGVGGEKNLKKK